MLQSKRFKKTADKTGDLVGNKVADKISSEELHSKNFLSQNASKELHSKTNENHYQMNLDLNHN